MWFPRAKHREATSDSDRWGRFLFRVLDDEDDPDDAVSAEEGADGEDGVDGEDGEDGEDGSCPSSSDCVSTPVSNWHPFIRRRERLRPWCGPSYPSCTSAASSQSEGGRMVNDGIISMDGWVCLMESENKKENSKKRYEEDIDVVDVLRTGGHVCFKCF